MESFDDILNEKQPVLVDFHATWCGPCKVMGPVVEEIAGEVQGSARVLKVDIDKNEELAEKYQIRSVPTFMIFSNGESVWRGSGVMDKAVILEQLKRYMV
ncbi:MAG: thioredoxin [Tannerellaceae bacterium]|nr:thioredoxin [Tannerellaceae bacterium]MCD8263858.1 thioredoxin [Tannerellaceae bacterium]